MKIVSSLILSSALAFAVPQNVMKRESPPRFETDTVDITAPPLCSFLKQCPDGQTCAGERQLNKRLEGLCVEKLIECTGKYNSLDNTCPKDKKYMCVPRANRKECSKDNPSLVGVGRVPDDFDPQPPFCGHCVESSKFAGLRGLHSWLTVDTRCKDDHPSLCFDFLDKKNPGHCLDESFFKTADVCPEWLIDNACDENDACGSGQICVVVKCVKGDDPRRCGKKMCMPENVIDRLPKASAPASVVCTVKPITRTIAEKETSVETVTVTQPGGKPKTSTLIITRTRVIQGPKETVTVTVGSKKSKNSKQNGYDDGY
ncbi:hypothetical protein TWF718_009637 [Orbilia javanica]|uniref:Uncharacterized protein n=1 Tax=Orbilia javanica TaxID=47235 RepID=A0AAN8RFS0_9PEZI